MTDQEILTLLAPVAVTAAFATTGLFLRYRIIRRYQLQRLRSDTLPNGHPGLSHGEDSAVSDVATNIVVRSEAGLSVLHLKSIAASEQDKEDFTTYLRRLAKQATDAPPETSTREISRDAQIEKIVTTIADNMTSRVYVPVKILQDEREDGILHSTATAPSSTKSR